MTISFDRYETEFHSLCTKIESSIPNIIQSSYDIESSRSDDCLNYNSASHDNSKQLLLISNQLNQCDDLVTQMSIEARDTYDTKQKRDYLSQVRHCKTRYRTLKDDFITFKSRIPLLGSSENIKKNRKNSKSLLNDSHKSKERLLSVKESLRSQTASLDRAMEVMAETEVVATEITEELQRNNEVIGRAHNKVRSMKGMTDRAKDIVNRMKMRSVRQKIIVSGVIGSLFMFLILYFWWF